MNCVHGEIREHILPRSGRSIKYPYIRAKLVIKGEEYGLVDFLIDTGAGTTLISPADALRLGMNKLKGRNIRIIGVSAAEQDIFVNGPVVIELVDSYDVNNILQIELEGITYRRLPKKRGQQFQEQLRLPSLLGWDVLKQLILEIDYNRGIVKLCKPE